MAVLAEAEWAPAGVVGAPRRSLMFMQQAEVPASPATERRLRTGRSVD